MRYALAVAAALALVVSLPAMADPSVFGPTGLLRVPTAATVPAGGMQFGSYYVNDRFFTASMDVGILDRLELSPAYINFNGGPSDLVVSGKWRVFGESESDRGYALSVGVFDLTDELNRSVYGVAEKHLTVGNTPVRAVVGWGEHNSLVDGIFAGAELSLGRDYTGIVEYDGNDVNAALRWPINDQIRVSVGAVSEKIFVGATYTLR